MSLNNAVSTLNANSAKLAQVVAGDRNTVVETPAGPLPSLAKLIYDAQQRIDTALELQRLLAEKLGTAGGAGAVITSDGKTVQAALDSKAALIDPTQLFAAKRVTAQGAANYVYIEGGAAGQAPAVIANGTDANVGTYFGNKGAGHWSFADGAGKTQFAVGSITGAINFMRVQGAAAGNPTMVAAGADANIGFDFTAKGAGEVVWRSGGGIQFVISQVAFAVNYLRVFGGTLGNGPTLGAVGSDANVDLILSPKGAGAVRAPKITVTGSDNYRHKQQSGTTGYGSFWRNDGANLYLMLTNLDDSEGNFNTLRPFFVNLATGKVTMRQGADIDGGTLTKPTIRGYIEQFQALNPGAAVTLNPDNGTLIELTTTANTTVTLPPAVAGMSYTLIVKYGGAHTLTFAGGSTLSWLGKGSGTNTAPPATMVAGKKDVYGFICGTDYTLGRDGGRNG